MTSHCLTFEIFVEFRRRNNRGKLLTGDKRRQRGDIDICTGSFSVFPFSSCIRYSRPRERFICNCGGFSRDIRDAITTVEDCVRG